MFCCLKRYWLGERPETSVGAELPEALTEQPTHVIVRQELPLDESPTILTLKSENKELRRQIEMMRNETGNIRSILRRHEVEIRVLRGTSYDGAIIWKVHPHQYLIYGRSSEERSVRRVLLWKRNIFDSILQWQVS